MGRGSANRRFHQSLWAVAGAAGAMGALLAWSPWSGGSPARGPLGEAAMRHVEALVALGPRPVGSEAHRQAQEYIIAQLQAAGAAVERDDFTARTPLGERRMANIIGQLGTAGGRILVLASHYETLSLDRFVGANDGGSSTGLLLALAPILARLDLHHEIRLVFFDGEEAFVQWSEQDSLYGSRHLAERWKADGTISRIGAFLLLDMVGDADLDLLKDSNSTPWLRDQIWSIARRLGYARHFLDREAAYEDDHLPFLRLGVPAVDLIDFQYGPANRYWHTPEDTLDKLSPASLQIVGEVVLETLRELDRQQ
ncbi:MAG TPA: M28 family peptidase [Terriglobia bacterium]|nr:M28 family peptidase [Terriglobia bacterium]